MRARLRVFLGVIATVAVGEACKTEDSLRLLGPVDLTFGDGHDGDRTITGLVSAEACVAVLSGTLGTRTLETETPLDAGGLFLITQVQDSFATVGDTSGLVSVAGAGTWEVVRVVSAEDTVAGLASDLLHSFDSAPSLRSAQACRMREYANLTLQSDSRLAASAWNGNSGGVVALFVAGELTLLGRSSIDADGLGFRPGAVSLDSLAEHITTDTTSTSDGAGKGEGLDTSAFGQSGRGNIANGAGGGNARNAGGGGGGGAGVGGRGGLEWNQTIADPATYGKPGAAIVLDVGDRLTMGGGGGGGHQNDTTGTPGAHGGGIVVVVARTLAGAGRIGSDGFDAAPSVGTVVDGAGGGGAGGTVYVLSENSSVFTGTLSSAGGNGGATSDTGGGVAERRGPGGGGGGGRVAAPPGILVDVHGGQKGVSTLSGDPWGATAGGDGVVELP